MVAAERIRRRKREREGERWISERKTELPRRGRHKSWAGSGHNGAAAFLIVGHFVATLV